MSFRIDNLYRVLRVSHLARTSTSADGISLGKLQMIVAALQCNLSSASKSSWRLNLFSKFFFRSLTWEVQLNLLSTCQRPTVCYIWPNLCKYPPRKMGGRGPVNDPLWVSILCDFFGWGVSLFIEHQAYKSFNDWLRAAETSSMLSPIQ